MSGLDSVKRWFEARAGRLRSALRDPTAGALFWAVLASLALLTLWWGASRWYEAQLVAEQRSLAVVEASLRGNALAAAVNRRLALLEGMHAFVLAEPSPEELEGKFEVFAAELFASAEGIRNIALSPGGVVAYVYPRAGNESVIGYDPLKDPRPAVREDTRRAIESRQIVLSGPLELVQGGQGLIARKAIYRGGEYWGLATLVLETPPILARGGLGAHQLGELDFALRNGAGQMIYGSSVVYEHDPIVYRIELPEDDWSLAGAPEEGWQAAVREQLWPYQGGGLTIVGLLASLVYLSVNRQARLARTVEQRTRQLTQLGEQRQRELVRRERAEAAQRASEARAGELSTLLEVSNSIASTLELEPLLDIILDQLKRAVDYTGASILMLEGRYLQVCCYRGPEAEERVTKLRFSLEEVEALWRLLERREPLLVEDVRGDSPLAQALVAAARPHLETALFGYLRAWMGIPLAFKDEVIGAFSIEHEQPGYYTPAHAKLASVIANQAAAAIANARLFAQAQELAALQERQKLARELHDSVSQALYGIALGARTARLLLERAALDGDVREPLAEPLDYILSLSEAGLAEMRALIFELRPEALEAEGLVTLLARQAEALRARHQLAVETSFGPEPELSLDAKASLFRIAQEALHNVVKHAQASRVELALRQADGEILLEVGDNGRGFEAGEALPGHLGMRSMRERAERAGGRLEVDSAPGQGTRLQAWLPLDA